nr:hypothetical protein [uncultured Mediterranean phage uvMED]
MELNITENLEKSVLLPLYTQENELNSDGMSAAEKLGLDTGNFYLDSQNRNEKNTQIPFYNEVEIKAKKKSLEMTKEFFVDNLPRFFKNLPEDALYGIFKGIENGISNTTEAFPGIKPFVDEVAEKNIAPEPFNLTLKQLSNRVHNLDQERDKTFANDLAGYMFQAAPYLFLARSRLIQGGIGIERANLLAWMFASGMGFKNEELLVSDVFAKSLGDSKFMDSLKKFDEKIVDTGVSVEGIVNFSARAMDGLLFEKLFGKIKEVYKNWKISKLPPKEKVKYLGDQKEIKKLSEGMVEQQNKPLKFFPNQDDVNTATSVIKNMDNPSDAVIDQIKKDLNVKEVIDNQKKGELGSTAEKFNNPEWQANRKFNFDGEEITGFENAINKYYGNGASKKDKIVHIMIGNPASGKSLKGNVIAEHFGSKVIDSDDFKLALTGKKNTSATSAVHDEGKFLADKTLQIAMGNGDNLVVPIIGKSEDKVMNYVNLFNQNGYTVKLVYAKAPTNKSRMYNIKRSLVTGRLIPDEYFSQDLDNKINFVYDVVKPKVDGSATIKTGTIRKNAIVEKETTGSGIY